MIFKTSMEIYITYFSTQLPVKCDLYLYFCLFFLLQRWNNLREMVDVKRDDINVAHGFQNFNIECNETIVSLSSLLKKNAITAFMIKPLNTVCSMQHNSILPFFPLKF